MPDTQPDPFVDLLADMSDGQRWAVLRSEGFDDFVERLSALIGQLEPRRRQAIIMLLFNLVEGFVAPEEAEDWIGSQDIDSNAGVEAMIAWLRERRHHS